MFDSNRLLRNTTKYKQFSFFGPSAILRSSKIDLKIAYPNGGSVTGKLKVH